MIYSFLFQLMGGIHHILYFSHSSHIKIVSFWFCKLIRVNPVAMEMAEQVPQYTKSGHYASFVAILGSYKWVQETSLK